MSDGSTGSDGRRIEMLAAVILGVAGLLTAFGAYKAALADGDALKGYTMSSQTTADANAFFNEAFATFTADQQLFLEYQLLIEEDQQDLAFAFRERFFSEELEAGLAAWEQIPAGDPDEPPTPLLTDEYTVPAQGEALRLTEQAATEFQDAQDIDDAGDKFELAAVFLSVALFLAGIGSLFKTRAIQLAILGMSALAVVPGVISILNGQSAL
jgi:hypothetical protein